MNLDLQKAVIEAREREHRLSAEKQQAYDNFQSIPANIELFNQVERAKLEREKAETALREAALGEYGVTGSKQPFLGVGIRVRERFDYAPETALAWAHEHKQALTLNVKEFEAIIKACIIKPPFVTIAEDVTATLAQDMAAVLEGVGE